jgi:hypothetical protein
MEIHLAIQRIFRFFSGSKKIESRQLLKQQRILLYQGYEGTAEVLDVLLLEERVGRLLPVRLWLKLKKADGSFIYTYSNSLLNRNRIPLKGQKLLLKYLPDDLSSVLILS